MRSAVAVAILGALMALAVDEPGAPPSLVGVRSGFEQPVRAAVDRRGAAGRSRWPAAGSGLRRPAAGAMTDDRRPDPRPRRRWTTPTPPGATSPSSRRSPGIWRGWRRSSRPRAALSRAEVEVLARYVIGAGLHLPGAGQQVPHDRARSRAPAARQAHLRPRGERLSGARRADADGLGRGAGGASI